MVNQSLIHFFQQTNLVSAKTAEEIAGAFNSKEFIKGQFLLKEGRICDEYFFLENGFMRAFGYDLEGNDVTTNF